jgi:putative YhbY family RNA-binding protein
MLALTPVRRRALPATAHALHPIVTIGEAGLSENVMHELDLGLKSHQLIKVKVSTGEREMRNGLLDEICQRLAAAPVQHIGKILVIYRPEPESATSEPKALSKKTTGGKNTRRPNKSPRNVAPAQGRPKRI